MKSILALIGGGERDWVIMQTAYAAAVALAARLDFLHVHVSAGIAMRYDKHAQFVMGAGIQSALEDLKLRSVAFSRFAADHAVEFHGKLLSQVNEPCSDSTRVAVNFREENDTSIDHLIAEASHSDLIVIGRARQTQGLSPDTLERLVKQCGRPVLVAATLAPQKLPGTIMVCWKRSQVLNRALVAAASLLKNASRIIVADVRGNDALDVKAANEVHDKFEEIGLSTELRVIPKTNGKVADALAAAADDCRADMVVMGAYGSSGIRELIFGSNTEEILGRVDRPILLMH
jgi:nucleotide-binding universal stress UspA family protein